MLVEPSHCLRETSSDAVAQDELRDALEQILVVFPTVRGEATIRRDHPVRPLFKRAAEILRKHALHGTVQVRWSAGQGRWAAVPWLAVLDTRETTKTSEGVYIAYLVRSDCSGIYLTLSQAASSYLLVPGGSVQLIRRVAELRRRIAVPSGFAATAVDLKARGARLARGYEAGAILHRLYDAGGIPDDDVLIADLTNLLALYEATVPTRRIVPL